MNNVIVSVDLGQTLSFGLHIFVTLRKHGFLLRKNGSIDVKIYGSVLEDKSSFKMLGFTFSCKFDWGSSIISIAKTASKKIVALICLI